MIAVTKKEVRENYKWPTSKNDDVTFFKKRNLHILGSKKTLDSRKSNDTVYLINNNISRFDHYYASINFKSTFLIMSNITFFGFLLTFLGTMSIVTFYIHFLLILMSLGFVFVTIKQYLKRYKGKNSLLVFDNIVNLEDNIFIDKVDSLSKIKYIRGLKEQNIVLAHGLILKSNYLNKASLFMMLNIILLII